MKREGLVAAVVCVVIALPAWSQSVAGMGGLGGMVRDASGAVVPAAKVMVANEAKGIRRSLETNHAGLFSAPALAPSTGYAVTVAKEGFAPWEARELEILVGQDISLNGFGGNSRVPFWPRSSLDIDQVCRTDARLSKILRFRENLKLYLNFEAFNVFNHISDTRVNTAAYQLRGSDLTPVAGPGDGAASEGFPDGTNARRAQLSLRFVF